MKIDEKADNYHSELARYRFVQFVGSDWYYLLYVPLFNVLLIYIMGSYALSAITYPYQNALVRESLDRGNAAKFGDEFAHFIQSFVYTLGVQAGINPSSAGGAKKPGQANLGQKASPSN